MHLLSSRHTVASSQISPAGWSLALLLLALASHAPALPLMAWLALGLALGSHWLPARTWSPFLGLGLLTLVLVADGVLYGWFDSFSLRLGLLLVLCLKWAESHSPREQVLVAAAALVAGSIGLLQWNDGVGLGLILLLALLALGVLETALEPGLSALIVAHRSLARLALVLPLTAVLFIFFPRIPGPLWDIGLSFGLPLGLSVEKSSQGLGVSTRLKLGQGQTQTGVRESQPVLVAEFENWVPPTSLLYWRGPVYYDFNGQEWVLDPEYESQGRKIMQQGWNSATAFAATLTRKTQEVRYTIRLTPHDRLWLYGLDLPASLTSESFVGPDWQVLSHRPVQEEMHYTLSSYLEWESRTPLSDAQRQRALALPPTGNPRLRELGRQLSKNGAADTDSRLRQALAPLAREGYKVRDKFSYQEGPDAFDRFWFEDKEGNGELYAGTLVFLMRAAGVPARLVTGYRGGKLMALTDYVVVKRSHAHAWAEVWDEARGWRRVDPVDLIAPERFASAAASPKPAPQPTAPKPEQTAPRPTGGSAPAGQFAAANMAPAAVSGSSWQIPDLGDLLGRWIFRLNGETQQSLLGGQGGGFAWAWLLGTGALGSGLVLGAGMLLARWRDSRRLPPPRRTWDRLCRLLTRRGLAPEPGECPSHFAVRVGLARPRWAQPMAELAQAYTDWRYAPRREDAPHRLQAAARRLSNLILADTEAPPKTP